LRDFESGRVGLAAVASRNATQRLAEGSLEARRSRHGGVRHVGKVIRKGAFANAAGVDGTRLDETFAQWERAPY
jgi:hypothetical protein